MVAKRKIGPKDHKFIADWIVSERKARGDSKERKRKELIWKEVDRQVAMTPVDNTGKEEWQSNIEPGMMADGLETFADDILRIAIPTDRNWNSPKVEMPVEIDSDGLPTPEEGREQKKRAGALRCLMSQQQLDTGFREAVKMSVKEAYKHGSFCAEVRFHRFPKWHKGGKQEELGAPIWIPHSMWNCFPAQTGTVQASALSYQGSMIITTEMTWADVMQNPKVFNKGSLKKKRDEKKPAKVIKFFGDMFVPRVRGTDIFLPNMEYWVINDTLVLAEENELPYPPIIFGSIEKDDVRDDYASSQLIKRSPTHKAAASALNDFVDASRLAVKPPVAYNSLDPAFAAQGLTIIEPGAEIPTRGRAEIKPIFVADPSAAFTGYQVLKQEVERGTQSDIRAGVAPSTEQTKFEISKIDQRSEVRTIDFVGIIERHGLRPFLYMQHEMNKIHLMEYPFYCNEPNLPSFMRAGKKDLKGLADVVNFEITGARGVLGEERRREGVLFVTDKLLQSEEGRSLVGEEGLAEVARDAYADFGAQDPERFIPNAPDIENKEVVKVSINRVEQIEAELNQALQELQEALAEGQRENFKLTEINERMKTDANSLAEDNKLLEEQIQTIERKGEVEVQLQRKMKQVEDRIEDLKREELAFELLQEKAKNSNDSE